MASLLLKTPVFGALTAARLTLRRPTSFTASATGFTSRGLAATAKSARPSRPKSAYNFFIKAKGGERPSHLSQKEWMASLAADWGRMDKNLRAQYESQARADRERHEREMGSYEKQKGPKRPMNAYMIFANEERSRVKSANPGASVPEIGKLLGQRWRSLSDIDKAPYVTRAEDLKRRYEEEKVAAGGI